MAHWPVTEKRRLCEAQGCERGAVKEQVLGRWRGRAGCAQLHSVPSLQAKQTYKQSVKDLTINIYVCTSLLPDIQTELLPIDVTGMVPPPKSDPSW